MDKQITSSLQNVFAGQPPGYIDRQTLSGELINHRQHSNWSPVMSTTENEVVTPHVIPMLRSKTNARTIVEPQPTTLRLLRWNFQPVTPPQSLNSCVIYTPSFLTKHHCDATIAVTTKGRCQIGHPFHQPGFIIRNMQSPTLRRSRLAENTARSAF